MKPDHRLTVKGWWWPTATCRCGWVTELYRGRGSARRAWDWHVWHAETDPARNFWAAVETVDLESGA